MGERFYLCQHPSYLDPVIVRQRDGSQDVYMCEGSPAEGDVDEYGTHELVPVRLGARTYAPNLPHTWTRAQLVAEMEARMGLRAPEGWEWNRSSAWRRFDDPGDGPTAVARVVDCTWAAGRGSWNRRNQSATLTGPDGAFAQAEKAAGVS